MNEQTTSFQIVLDSLLEPGKDFPRQYLPQFSDIGPLELKTLMEVWSRVNTSRKLSLLEGLKVLAEADTLVSFEEVGRAVLNDPDAAVRIRAIRLLEECKDEKLIPTYLDFLKNDADTKVRAEAAKALGLFVELGELDELPAESYAELKTALLESASKADDPNVRRRALESLGYSSHPEAVALIETAFGQEAADWKVSALIAMGRSADERWEDRVLRSLLDENDRIRRAAVQSAGNLALKSARLPLLRMLEQEDNDEITAAAIWSLSQIGGEDVQLVLEALLDQTEDEKLVEFLEGALDNLAFTEDLDRFELMSYNPDELGELDEIDDDETM